MYSNIFSLSSAFPQPMPIANALIFSSALSIFAGENIICESLSSNGKTVASNKYGVTLLKILLGIINLVTPEPLRIEAELKFASFIAPEYISQPPSIPIYPKSPLLLFTSLGATKGLQSFNLKSNFIFIFPPAYIIA